ncbi:hypothetical protein DV737_g223, partial [Chaetothyriales sp. CBS 132003]
MPTYSAVDRESRQSSGKSFFRRNKDRAQDTRSIANGPVYESSINGSVASAHYKSESIISVPDKVHDAEHVGLHTSAGVIASIPYSSTADSAAPVSIDYVPREDYVPGARRDTQPHQLARGTDHHQYASVNGPQNGSSHVTGLRPGPHIQNITMASSQGGDRGTKYQQWGQPANHEANHGQFDSISSESSHGQRRSLDGQSIRSQTSSKTRESSIFSSDTTPRPSAQSRQDSDNLSVLSPTNHRLSKLSSHSAWPSQQMSPFNSPSSPAGFNLPKPAHDEDIERMFIELMHKRGWQNLPEQARRQMLAYPPAKKWTLVHQDRLTEWQGEQKRRQQARQTGLGDGRMAQPDMEGTPEWYVKKILDDSINTKQLQSLSVSLRTQPIHWVKAFIEAQGQIALTNVLMKINRRQASGPTLASAANSSDKDLDREYDIVKCLKALMNNKFGADDALTHQQIPISLALCLISPRLTTRKLVSEVMTFLCHCGEGLGHRKVLQAMDHVKGMINENGRFDAWMRIVEVTTDGRGKMGSLVGASDEVRSGGVGMENLLMEYAVATLVLVNSIVEAPERDLQLRCHLRAQFNGCGLKRLMTKMKDFKYDVIDKQIQKYLDNEEIDNEDLLQHEGSSIVDGVAGEPKDLTDPLQITDAIMSRIQGTRTQDYFISAMQHLLILRENNSEDRLRMFQLVDAMLSYVAMDRRLPDMDLKQSLNFTVQSLLDSLYTDSEARIAFDEATESRQIAEAALSERDEMASQIAMGANGLVQKLQKQIEEQQAIIDMQTRQAESLKSEIAELQRLRNQELQRNELETRELYLMLRDAQDVAASHAKSAADSVGKDAAQMQGILDREKLMERLETNLERTKTQFKLEGKIWGLLGPSDRLRELREQMDDVPEADFEEKTRKTLTSSIIGSQIIFEKPRLVELKRPKMPQDQQASLFDEMAAKLKRIDASDDEGEYPWLRPKKKLKAFHWDRVDTPEVTVWAGAANVDVKEEKFKELQKKGVLDEVEKLFFAKDIKILGSGPGKGKNDKKQLISSDMMRNFSVAMAKFKKYSADEVVRKIIHCDREVLDDVNTMDFLQREDLCTVPENLAKLMAPYSKDWTGPDALTSKREQDPSELTREDQIYLQTAYELHHYWKSRMRALALTRNYEADYDHISQKMNKIVDASESLRNSVKLMNVFGVILDLGNYMNDANKQASGFKLSSLARLAMIKDEKNEMSFADFVEKTVRNQYNQYEPFVDEIWTVVAVAKVNVDQLQADAKRYIDTIANVQSSLDAGNLSDAKKFHPQDRVAQVVQRSMKDARRKAEQMQLILDETTRTYNEIMTFFGEDPRDENDRRDFFNKLANFLLEWKKSREKNMEREEAQRRMNNNLARKKALHSANVNGLASIGETSGAPTSRGDMDSLLEKLRAAGPPKDQKDRRRKARLKGQHQERLASGQQIPPPQVRQDIEDSRGISSKSEGEGDQSAEETKSEKPAVPASDDVAERVARALREIGSATPIDDDELRIRRRREGADEERKARRMKRRTAQTSTTSDAQTKESTTTEPKTEGKKELDSNNEGQKMATVVDGGVADEDKGDDDRPVGENTRSSPSAIPDIVVTMDLDPAISKSQTSDALSFAYTSARDRWPVIITGAIDDVHRAVSALLLANDTTAADDSRISEGKLIISQLASLKYELQHNRKLEPIADDGEADVRLYNEELELRGGEKVSWHDAEWLYAECYLYRRIATFFNTTTHWKGYDPFGRQKLSTFKSSRSAVVELAARYREIIVAATHDMEEGDDDSNIEKQKERVLFTEMAEICLWGNATDLSLLTNLSYEDIQKLQGSEARKSREKSEGGRVDIVLDNAGFELFVDLVLAGYLLATGLASEVVLHPKSIPWFVSDVLPKDFAELISAVQDPKAFYETSDEADGQVEKPLSQKEEDDIKFLFSHWSKLHTDGRLILRPSRFWTHPGSFWRLPKFGAEVLTDLKHGHDGQGSELVIFKGDLNYRKLVGDGEWDPTTPFQQAIGPLGVSSGLRVLALRTCKADTVVGLAAGEDEKLRHTVGVSPTAEDVAVKKFAAMTMGVAGGAGNDEKKKEEKKQGPLPVSVVAQGPVPASVSAPTPDRQQTGSLSKWLVVAGKKRKADDESVQGAEEAVMSPKPEEQEGEDDLPLGDAAECWHGSGEPVFRKGFWDDDEDDDSDGKTEARGQMSLDQNGEDADMYGWA